MRIVRGDDSRVEQVAGMQKWFEKTPVVDTIILGVWPPVVFALNAEDRDDLPF